MQFQLMDPQNAGKVPVNLFSDTAEEIAKKVYNSSLRGKKNKPTQIRKFYDEVVSFDTRLRSIDENKKNDEFQAILPYLKMLNAKAAYAEARDLITKEFRAFLSDALKQIKTLQQFQVFVHLFEAFMGYYKYLDEKGDMNSASAHVPQGNTMKGGKK